MKELIKKIPILGKILSLIYRRWVNPIKPFVDSKSYWIERYETGGNSGDGSFGKYAELKADTVNAFVEENNISSIIEYGCGDGNQLSFSKYPSYLGFDVSRLAIFNCRKKFRNDKNKIFKMVEEYDNETADLTLSLDVIYHLVEDGVFTDYMNRLFDSTNKYVIIYSSNTDVNPEVLSPHVRHRNFTKWIETNKKNWVLDKHIPNIYPYNPKNETGTFADFYIYRKP